ncbi:MAG TPA: trimeric intracellular cation channel family protein [Paludibacteraceae bacterium]|nr:trimeric intracellular cation channel family protein [Paludibacteraceae bacterium]HOU68977.1 trimeric intracellular cation channel family protein [Paludibacteraceae bacterium]HPH63699.1 trimeric intracellular cation channel family protein [Paludibacteraceae bacterium]HQF50776.1 trimeric intracellular cation channel family protein [Paludibacteraceae bacterium]
MPSFVDILEYIGTFAFAISGIRLASRKDFDIFGAYVVGIATAIGGGTIRDLLLDTTPFWLMKSSYLVWSAIALFFVIIFKKHLIRLNNTFFIFDTIGLALFTVVGIEKTTMMETHYPFWVAIIMGAITGAAGGVIRDILINEIPLIFRKEIYALACVIGGLFYYISLQIFDNLIIVQIISAASVFLTRLIAVAFHVGLPHIRTLEHEEESSRRKMM